MNRKYKTILSLTLGIISFITIKYAIILEWNNFSINFVWSLILPLLVTLSFGPKYGIISIVGGLLIFYPFILGYNNGWASIVPSLALILWILIHGYGRNKWNIYLIQVIYSFIRILLYIFIFPSLIKLNPPFWNKDAILEISRNVVFLFAIKGIVVEFILVSLANTFLLLPFIRKVFLLDIVEGSEKNTPLLFSIVGLGVLYTIIILLFNSIVVFDKGFIDLSILLSGEVRLNILLGIVLFFILGGFTVKYLQKNLQSQIALRDREEKYKDISKKLNILNEELEDRIKDRTLELEYAVEELEEYSYVISHDLKTPLRAIDGYAEFILEDYKNEEELDLENLESISRIANDTIKMIERLLSYSTTSKRELFLEKVDLNNLILEVIEDYKAGNDKKDINLKIEKPLPKLNVDIVLFSQIISNIISNSIKFSKEKQALQILIDFEIKDNKYIISFKDNGVGFDMKYSDKVFGIFERLHRTEDYDGMGIGLATIKKIIQKHKGEVWVDSNLGEGTIIYIKIPINLS